MTSRGTNTIQRLQRHGDRDNRMIRACAFLIITIWCDTALSQNDLAIYMNDIVAKIGLKRILLDPRKTVFGRDPDDNPQVMKGLYRWNLQNERVLSRCNEQIDVLKHTVLYRQVKDYNQDNRNGWHLNAERMCTT
jgi:hypothetical protein